VFQTQRGRRHASDLNRVDVGFEEQDNQSYASGCRWADKVGWRDRMNPPSPSREPLSPGKEKTQPRLITPCECVFFFRYAIHLNSGACR
jgi:hypothetical protein